MKLVLFLPSLVASPYLDSVRYMLGTSSPKQLLSRFIFVFQRSSPIILTVRWVVRRYIGRVFGKYDSQSTNP